MIAHDFPNFEATTYASQGNAILGIRDSGKTVTAEGLAERLMDGGIPITVIDPIGRWRFLRVPGKGKGYPVVVAGGADGDLPLTPQNAESLIRAAMQNRISIVFDLYEMDISKADWRRICEAVVRTMLYENKRYAGHHVGLGTVDAVLKYLVENAPGAIDGVVREAAALRDAQAFTQSAPETPRPAPSPIVRPPHRVNGHAEPKGGAELRILRVLAARAPARFTRPQWATLSGMKRTGGTWQTYVSRLRQAGYIDERDGLVGLTAAGAKAAGHVTRPSAGSVIADWKEALGSGPAKMIDQIIGAHPAGMDRANLADSVGMTATGGTFQTYLSRLKSNGLIEVSGRRIKASDALFIDARQQ